MTRTHLDSPPFATLSVLLASLATAGCSRGDPGGPATGTSSAPAAPVAAPPSAGATRYAVDAASEATFLIDAPLEKIRGRASGARGSLDVDPEDLSRTRGHVEVDLSTLVTETFESADKNRSQTGHARNWLELGPDTEPAAREANRHARLELTSVELEGPRRVADLAGAPRPASARVRGTLRIQGVTTEVDVRCSVSVALDPSGAPALRVVTAEPLRVSLRAHDIKPRDLAGRFLDGALERIGQKIDDAVQVSVALSLRPGAPG